MRDHAEKMRYRSFKKIHSFSVGLEDSPDLLVGFCIPNDGLEVGDMWSEGLETQLMCCL